MARGNEIVVSAYPRGYRIEGTIVGTPLPGTAVTLVPATGPTSGRFSWQVYSPPGGNDGTKSCLSAILDCDWEQGMIPGTAYVTGARCFIYCPLPGDEVNVLVHNVTVSGTADNLAIGDWLVPQWGTGLFLRDPGLAKGKQPCYSLEADTALGANTLVWTQFQ